MIKGLNSLFLDSYKLFQVSSIYIYIFVPWYLGR